MSFHFQEIEGKKRIVALDGSTAPKGGFRRETAFELGGELRKKEHFEPGADTPATHVAGKKYVPLKIEGEIRDSLLGAQGRADEKIAAITAIADSGLTLRIVWNSKLFIGQLDKWTFPTEDAGEYRYALEFAVWGTGAIDGAIRSPIASVSLSSNALVVEDAVKASLASYKLPSMSLSLSATIDALFAPLFGALTQFLSTVEAYEAGLEDTVSAGQRLLGQCDMMMNRILACVSFFDALTGEYFDGVDAILWRRRQAQALADLDAAIKSVWQVGESVESALYSELHRVPERLYVTSQGDTFEALARLFDTSFERLVALNPTVPVGPLRSGITLRIA